MRQLLKSQEDRIETPAFHARVLDRYASSVVCKYGSYHCCAMAIVPYNLNNFCVRSLHSNASVSAWGESRLMFESYSPSVKLILLNYRG